MSQPVPPVGFLLLGKREIRWKPYGAAVARRRRSEARIPAPRGPTAQFRRNGPPATRGSLVDPKPTSELLVATKYPLQASLRSGLHASRRSRSGSWSRGTLAMDKGMSLGVRVRWHSGKETIFRPALARLRTFRETLPTLYGGVGRTARAGCSTNGPPRAPA